MKQPQQIPQNHFEKLRVLLCQDQTFKTNSYQRFDMCWPRFLQTNKSLVYTVAHLVFAYISEKYMTKCSQSSPLTIFFRIRNTEKYIKISIHKNHSFHHIELLSYSSTNTNLRGFTRQICLLPDVLGK